MKAILCRLIMGSIVVLAPVFAPTASAERIEGIVVFVRTFGSETVNGVPMARFEFRVVGTCDGTETRSDGVFIRVRSGPLGGALGEVNSLTFKNAYSTVLSAFLSGNFIQVDNVPNCVDDVQTINSPAGIGTF